MKKTLVVLVSLLFTIHISNAASYQFTKNLTLGSTGADVAALQNLLISKGFSTRATGYFGSLTKAALTSYQKVSAIKPASGYFGPLTRASLNSSVISTATTTTPTTNLISTTEGLLTVNLSGTPSNNTNINHSIDVPVYGLNLTASNGVVTLNRFDLQVEDYIGDVVGTNSENPATLIQNIKVWDGETLLKTFSGTSLNFIKDSNNSNLYYIRLAGLGLNVPSGQKKNLIVTFSTSNIDSDRTVVLQGYSGGHNTNIQTSSAGIDAYYGADGTNFTRTHIFKKPGVVTMTLTSDSSETPGYGNYHIYQTTGALDNDLSMFKVQASGNDSIITDITMNVTASGTAPSALYLYDSDVSTSTPVDSVSPTGFTSASYADEHIGSVSFHNLNIPVTRDEYKTLDVHLDMPSGTIDGSYVSVGDGTTTITYQDQNGTSGTLTQNGLLLYPSYFYSAAPNFELVKTDVSADTSRGSASTQNLVGTFVLEITPFGSSMNSLQPSDITVAVGTTSADALDVSEITVNVTPNDSLYADGGTYTATITALAPNSLLSQSGLYTFYLNGINWGMTNGVVVNPNFDFSNLVYTTKSVSFTK